MHRNNTDSTLATLQSLDLSVNSGMIGIKDFLDSTLLINRRQVLVSRDLDTIANWRNQRFIIR
jgi:hypothetical protein